MSKPINTSGSSGIGSEINETIVTTTSINAQNNISPVTTTIPVSASATVSFNETNNVNINFNNSNKMIQQQSNQQQINNAAGSAQQPPPPPRLHPKKRKFDLSELEENEPSTPSYQTTEIRNASTPPTTSGSTTIFYQHKNTDVNNGQECNNMMVSESFTAITPQQPYNQTQMAKNLSENRNVNKKQYTAMSIK